MGICIYVCFLRRKPSFRAWEIVLILRQDPLAASTCTNSIIQKRAQYYLFHGFEIAQDFSTKHVYLNKGERERQSNKDKKTLQQIMFRFIV